MTITATPNSTTAFDIPSILIGLPDGASLEVSWITFKCISVFEHRDGVTTQVRGHLGLCAFIAELTTPEPEPSEPIAFPVRLFAQTSVAAQDSHMKDNVIKVSNAPAPKGEMMHKGAQGINGMVQAINQFRVKYNGKPNLIKLNSQDRPDMTAFDGITVEHTDAVPAGRVWVGVK
jgi:hypothetical protein